MSDEEKQLGPATTGCLTGFGAVVGLLWSLGAVGFLVWLYGVNDLVVQPKYFEVAAQVIPVLLLAAALERHYFDVGNRSDPLTKALNVIVLLWLVAGEAAAMIVVMVGEVTALAFGLTTNALLIAATLLVMLALGGPWTPRR
jgi:hypothetical protein